MGANLRGHGPLAGPGRRLPLARRPAGRRPPRRAHRYNLLLLLLVQDLVEAALDLLLQLEDLLLLLLVESQLGPDVGREDLPQLERARRPDRPRPAGGSPRPDRL